MELFKKLIFVLLESEIVGLKKHSEIIAENFQNLFRDINLQVQEAE